MNETNKQTPYALIPDETIVGVYCWRYGNLEDAIAAAKALCLKHGTTIAIFKIEAEVNPVAEVVTK